MNALPAYMQDSVRLYIERGQPPGDFLRAVLENNLIEAFGHADEENERCMRVWARWLYMDVPSSAWGSRKTVNTWIAKGGLMGRAARDADAADEVRDRETLGERRACEAERAHRAMTEVTP